ncbi:MAG: DNA primase [Desulfobacteraceae bacterium]|nr:MAG: DNA primase [Desulfobacteraceae bacterium]
MGFNHSAKEEIRRASDIVELVGQFVQLRKAGRNYVGLCPFHAEKDPSFTVNPERQTYHCFGCKKGGDIYAFWMEYHSTTFPEALRDLAEKYNVTIPEGIDTPAEKQKAAQKKALFVITEKSAAYFQSVLNNSPKGGAGRDYLNGRSISNEIITEFRLGYAPDEWDGLVRELKNHDVDLDMAVQAGMIIPKKNGGYYDRFRGRIIFPIIDLRQQVVGFGGRVLDDSLPKYVNTPETPLYHKGEFLYGLHASHKSIRKKGRAVIVEGYMDWLALRKHGLQEVVATLGTALTASHVRKLKGYAKKAVIVFDSDEAGKAAVLKSLPIFSNEGLSASAVVLPDSHDPDSFVNANGSGSFLELLDRASPMFDFYLEQKLEQVDSDMEGKIRVLKEIFPLLCELRTSTQRSLYVRRLSERIGSKEEALWSELSAFMKKPSAKASENRLRDRLTPSRIGKRFDDLHLLNLLIHYPHTLSRLTDCEWRVLLSDSAIIEIVNTIFEKYRQEGAFSPEELLDDLESDVARKQLREALVDDSHYSEQEVEQAVAEILGKAHKISISASFKKAKGDVQAQNQLLELKRLKDKQVLNNEF